MKNSPPAHLLGAFDFRLRPLHLLLDRLFHVLGFLSRRAQLLLDLLLSSGRGIDDRLLRLARCLFCVLPHMLCFVLGFFVELPRLLLVLLRGLSFLLVFFRLFAVKIVSSSSGKGRRRRRRGGRGGGRGGGRSELPDEALLRDADVLFLVVS